MRLVIWFAIIVLMGTYPTPICFAAENYSVTGKPLMIVRTPEKLAQGPFKPDWNSLKQYRTPQWFKDAKFGIWAHWSAQCVPAQGDWYARFMYIQGSDDYKYQLGFYGHPSVFGFKDIDHIWHAEHWDPEKLMDLYKRAGRSISWRWRTITIISIASTANISRGIR